MKSIPLALALLCSPGSPTVDPSSDVTDHGVFDQTIPINARSLRPGDVIRMKALVNVIAVDGERTLTLRPQLGHQSFGTMEFVVSNHYALFVIDWTLVVIETGEGGDITGWGTIAQMDARGTPGAVHGDMIIATEIDTTTTLDACVSAIWDVANPNNRIRLEHLIVDIQ